jgi:hypothetical protein|tara:strand:+ start:44 stop:247 length:204 start_codon:yes stop_codon:yes gene_type:complete
MSDKLELGTKQDLEMLISELDNFYSYRGRKFFKLLDEDDRIDLEDRMYNLKEDLEEKFEELKQLEVA